MYSSTHSATYISIYSSIYSSGKVLELCMSKIPQPPGMVACRHPLSLSLSFSVVLSSHLWLSLSLSHLSCRSCSRAAFALALSLINWSLLRGRYCRGNLLEWCPGLIRLICTCVIEDTINNRTCWNGVLPSLFVSLSLGRLLFLSRAIFDPSLISRSLSPSLARARAHSCSKAHLHLCPRGHHWHPNLLEWCPAVTLCHRLFPSLALSLCLSLTHSLTHSLAHSLTHSFTHSLTHSLTHSFTQSLTQSLTHAVTQSLSH